MIRLGPRPMRGPYSGRAATAYHSTPLRALPERLELLYTLINSILAFTNVLSERFDPAMFVSCGLKLCAAVEWVERWGIEFHARMVAVSA